MSDRVKITGDTRVRVLAFQGLESEYYDGIPEAWIECFGTNNETNPEVPTFDRILYLRNINLYPSIPESINKFLPIWHAGVIAFSKGIPATMLLISETELMDELVREHPPMNIVRVLFPMVNTSDIRVDLIDAEEVAQDNGVHCAFPSIVLEGWPEEEMRANYLRMKQIARAISESAGETEEIGFSYAMKTREIEIQLPFIFLCYNAAGDELLWIQRDEMKTEKYTVEAGTGRIVERSDY